MYGIEIIFSTIQLWITEKLFDSDVIENDPKKINEMYSAHNQIKNITR